MMRARLLCAALLAAPLAAHAMEPLSDAALSKVQGRDGMSFNLNNFAMSGNAELRYYTANDASSFAISNVSAARSDDAAAPFADPYRLDVIASTIGAADLINLAFPLNAAGAQVWQLAYDLSVSADGVDAYAGAVVLSDLAYYGGGWQWSTPRVGDGIAFGHALRMSIGSLALLANGRSQPNEQMTLSGVHVNAADADGNSLAMPWQIADLNNQPGIFNARTDANGKSSLHLGIDWPDGSAPVGQLQIDNISFRSDVTGTTNLGSSRIGAIQIQYLDIKFRN